MQTVKIDQLIPDAKNANKGTDRGRKALLDSLKRYGGGRSVLLDKDGRIIAGNKTVEAAAGLGIEDVIIVQTDGKQIVAVQRTDLDIDSPEGRGLAIADNRVGELDLSWDVEQLLENLKDGVDLEGLFDDNDLSELLANVDAGYGDGAEDAQKEPYSREIKSPVYEPKNEKPEQSALFDESRTKKLIGDIDAADMPEDVKAFLRVAAQRHTVLYFNRIADYYAHAPASVQRLMEDSALVIIDFKRAIELGYVELTKNIAELVKDEYGN